MTPQVKDAVATELKRFAQELNLTDSQKEQMRTNLAEKHAELEKFMQQNPNVSRQEIVQRVISARRSIRERIVAFLTPPQLEKWDAEVAKAKEFLGHKAAA